MHFYGVDQRWGQNMLVELQKRLGVSNRGRGILCDRPRESDKEVTTIWVCAVLTAVVPGLVTA